MWRGGGTVGGLVHETVLGADDTLPGRCHAWKSRTVRRLTSNVSLMRFRRLEPQVLMIPRLVTWPHDDVCQSSHADAWQCCASDDARAIRRCCASRA